MTSNQKEFPFRVVVDIAPGRGDLARLFACLDEGCLKGQYAFGRYANPQRSEFELYFKDEDAATAARILWTDCLQKVDERLVTPMP